MPEETRTAIAEGQRHAARPGARVPDKGKRAGVDLLFKLDPFLQAGLDLAGNERKEGRNKVETNGNSDCLVTRWGEGSDVTQIGKTNVICLFRRGLSAVFQMRPPLRPCADCPSCEKRASGRRHWRPGFASPAHGCTVLPRCGPAFDRSEGAQTSLSPEASRLQVSLAKSARRNGGPSRNRTGVYGFAVRCVTTPPSGLMPNGRSCRTARVGLRY
jgi:hypothetical protein